MRMFAALMLINLFLATTLEGAGDKNKVKNVCKRADVTSSWEREP
jgi:hypothetical protein